MLVAQEQTTFILPYVAYRIVLTFLESFFLTRIFHMCILNCIGGIYLTTGCKGRKTLKKILPYLSVKASLLCQTCTYCPVVRMSHKILPRYKEDRKSIYQWDRKRKWVCWISNPSLSQPIAFWMFLVDMIPTGY